MIDNIRAEPAEMQIFRLIGDAPLDITYIGMWFFHTVLIMHKPTNEKLAFLFIFNCSRDMTDTKIRKKYKNSHNGNAKLKSFFSNIWL